MFFHKQELQFKSKPTKPDAVYARKLQELLGGQYDEITVALQYGFQTGNSHLPGKYRDLRYGIGAEEMGHVKVQDRLQVARLHHMTDDHGVREVLSFLLARDTMHQNQWIAAARELQSKGAEWLPVPSNFPIKKEERSRTWMPVSTARPRSPILWKRPQEQCRTSCAGSSYGHARRSSESGVAAGRSWMRS